MSRVDDLIQRFCPNGVEYTPLGSICRIETGKLNANASVSDGRYLFFTTAKEISKIDSYRWDTEALLIAGNANVGDVKHYKGKFDAYQRTYVLSDFNEHISVRFLYFFISSALKSYLENRTNSAAMTYIVLSTLKDFMVPVLPLEAQKEIVNILDKFTQIEAELSAELEARQRQYEYYRDYLFFDDGRTVHKRPLATLVKKIYSGGTPKTGSAEYWDGGTIPWMSSGEVNLGTVRATEKYITEAGLKNSSAKWVPKNSVVIALAGQGKTRGTVARTRIDLTTNQSLASLVFDEKVINPNYAFHYLRSQYQELRRISSGDGTRGGLNLKMIGNFEIPVVSLSEQDRIVSILDKFELLINDMAVGLPAEIEARRQQYEYYRTKLLTFQELSV